MGIGTCTHCRCVSSRFRKLPIKHHDLAIAAFERAKTEVPVLQDHTGTDGPRKRKGDNVYRLGVASSHSVAHLASASKALISARASWTDASNGFKSSRL